MKKAIITRIKKATLSFLYEDDELTEIIPVEDDDLGNIYVGRVENIVHKINACFVNIGFEKPHYLNDLENINLVTANKFNNGSYVLVQLHKGPKKDKPGSVTSYIELNGKHTVMKLGKSGVGISRKVTNHEDKLRLKKLGNRYLRVGYGLVFRTSAKDASDAEIEKDIDKLYALFEDIRVKAAHLSKQGIVYETPRQYLDRIRGDVEVVTDDDRVYATCSSEGINIEKYTGTISLARLYRLERIIEKALLRRVYLKSGANIMIQDTEAMTVIDINSAKAITGGKRGKGIFEINQEAAKEILRQIRIRNISGIIMIDFVNMTSESQRNKIIELLEDLARYDYAKIVVYGFTRLGILEMSRKRIRTNLAEYMAEKDKR